MKWLFETLETVKVIAHSCGVLPTGECISMAKRVGDQEYVQKQAWGDPLYIFLAYPDTLKKIYWSGSGVRS